MISLLRALGFLTRLPLPVAATDITSAELTRSCGWFPVAGTLIGATTVCLTFAFELAWPVELALFVALALEALGTGAFHEDALADSCDAFGGRHSRERTLQILKDSSLGTYGVMGLLLGVGLRFGATASLDAQRFSVAVIVASTTARWALVLLMARAAPAGAGLAAHVMGDIPARAVLLASAWTVLGWLILAWTMPLRAAVAALATALVLVGCARISTRRLGGMTGDTLGATGYLVQLVVLLACAG